MIPAVSITEIEPTAEAPRARNERRSPIRFARLSADALAMERELPE
jgi:hypothetical protein